MVIVEIIVVIVGLVIMVMIVVLVSSHYIILLFLLFISYYLLLLSLFDLGFVDDETIVPILSAGHFNLTKKNFTNGIIQNKMILVGFSSYSCLKVSIIKIVLLNYYFYLFNTFLYSALKLKRNILKYQKL